jgi:hypothetical protein
LISRIAQTIAVLGVAIQLGSCAASIPKVSDAVAANLTANQGVVFGRMAVVKDGHALTTDLYRNLLKPEVAVHLSPFESMEKLARNEWLPGKWFFRAHLLKGGYFSTTLPAGKYYFVEFMFIDVTREMLALRTYDSNSAAQIFRPAVVTFEVLPGKTTYIGTIVHKIDEAGRGAGWSMDITDESADATQWFKTQHPRSDAIESELAVSTVVQ